MKVNQSFRLGSLLLLGAIILTCSTAIASPTNAGTDSLHRTFAKLINSEDTEAISQSDISASLLFTVTENGTLEVVNVLTDNNDIKEYFESRINGTDASPGLEEGEIYRIDVRLMKL